MTNTRTAVSYGSPEELPDQLEITTVVDPANGLAGALEPISAGQAGTLFVHRLESVAGSFGELIRLLDWLAEAGADLVAADVGLDTATPRAGGWSRSCAKSTAGAANPTVRSGLAAAPVWRTWRPTWPSGSPNCASAD